MLLIDGTELTAAQLQEVISHPYLLQKCASFLGQPQAIIPANEPALCLMQGECAHISFKSGSQRKQLFTVGSQDATTCITMLVSCSKTSNLFAAHIDTHELTTEDTLLLRTALLTMQEPRLYLAGGYCDSNSLGPLLSQSILTLFHSQIAQRVHLELACLAQLNTAEDGSPKTRQLLLHPDEGVPRPCLFTNRGPCVARRFACQHCR